MPYNMIILYFVYLIFMSQIVLYFLYSTSVLSFYIDVVLTLSICRKSNMAAKCGLERSLKPKVKLKFEYHNDIAICIPCLPVVLNLHIHKIEMQEN